MARARNIKPGFFKNESLAECTPWARLCFAGLWTLADREGRLEDRPKRIKGDLFAFDSIEVEPLLRELVKWKFIVRYVVGDVAVIQILKFSEHQRPHFKEAPGNLPPDTSQGLYHHSTGQEPGVLPPLNGPQALDKVGAGHPFNDTKAEENPDKSGEITHSMGCETACSMGGQSALIPDTGYLIPDTGVNTRSPTYRPEPDGFAVWWVAYRRKDAKQDAAKAWKALKPDAAMQAVMLSALARWPWAKDRLHIPLPATWLRGKRWEDEAITGSSSPAESTGPPWYEIAGFPNENEARNERCHCGNYTRFHEGKRIAEGASH